VRSRKEEKDKEFENSIKNMKDKEKKREK